MKTISNILITHAIFLLLFAGATLALAQETDEADLATSTDLRNQNQATNSQSQSSEIREGRQAEREAVRSDRKITLQARAQTRVTNLIANMSNRIDAATARLQNIANRLDSRIDKLSAEGINTEDAELALASAQTSIGEAATSMEGIDLTVREVVTSDDFIAGWQDIRTILTETKSHLQTAKTELRATIAELKTAIDQPAEGQTEEASNTDSEEVN